MKKVIIIIIIFSLVFISFFVFNKDEKIENKNISVILETEEGNIESNTFPSKEDYEYLSTECKNTSDNINTTFNEETWKLNLNVEEERIDGKFNCTVHFKENIKPNEPVLDESMVPVYYSDADSTWKVADKDNKSTEHKWYDYEEKMWANSVTYDHTKLIDLSSKNNDITFSGPSYTNEGISFDGVDDYIDAGYENYDFGNKVTLIARFKIEKFLDDSEFIVGNLNEAGFYLAAALYSGEDFRVGTGIYTNESNSYHRIYTDESIELNKWYTAVTTYDGNELKLYINGKLKTSSKFNDTIKITSTPFSIGANPNLNGEHMEYTDGTISDAIVINDVLTEEEIKENYSAEVNYKENDKTLFAYDLQGYEGREAGSTVPMEAISTMQVWIPRYKYKIWNYNLDGTKTSEEREIEIKFEKGTKTTGDIKCTDNIQGEDGDGTSEVCRINNEECSDSLCNGAYYTHPAFTFGSDELTGFWVGKFEITGEIENITTKPNISSLRNEKVGDFETNIMKMNDSGNKYGISSTTDTHMIKNSEWGAVAYLSHSKYGSCSNGICKEIGMNNNSNYITGCGANAGSSESTSCNSYETELGSSASTTENIYGVYDMSGGAHDAVMGSIVSPDGLTMMSGRSSSDNSGYTGITYDSGNYTMYTGSYTYPDSKYYDKYSFGLDRAQISRSKLGDGIKEVYKAEELGWYEDFLMIGNSTGYPWIVRGSNKGYGQSINSGIFSSRNYYGYAYEPVSTRIIIN